MNDIQKYIDLLIGECKECKIELEVKDSRNKVLLFFDEVNKMDYILIIGCN